MALNYRKIYLYINTTTTSLVRQDGTPLDTNDYPFFYLGEKVVLCCQFYETGTTPLSFLASEFLECSLDNNYNHQDDLMAYADDVFVNIPGDWSLADISAGRFSIRLNCYNQTYAGKVGVNPSITAYLEMKKFDSGLETVLLQNSCVANNVINFGTGVGPLPGREYYDKIESESLFMQIMKDNTATITDLTIDTNNAIQKVSPIHYINPNTGAFGELETITNGEEGDRLLLVNRLTNTNINIKHNVGNILTPYEQDIILKSQEAIWLTLQNSKWIMLLNTVDTPRLRAVNTDVTSYLFNVRLSECDGRPFNNYGSDRQVAFLLPECRDGLYFHAIVEENESLVVKPQDTNLIVGVGTNGYPVNSSEIGSTIQLRGTNRGWYRVSQYGNWQNINNKGLYLTADLYNNNGFFVTTSISMPLFVNPDGQTHVFYYSNATYTTTSLKNVKLTFQDYKISSVSVSTSLNSVATILNYTYNSITDRWETNQLINSDTLESIKVTLEISSSSSSNSIGSISTSLSSRSSSRSSSSINLSSSSSSSQSNSSISLSSSSNSSLSSLSNSNSSSLSGSSDNSNSSNSQSVSSSSSGSGSNSSSSG